MKKTQDNRNNNNINNKNWFYINIVIFILLTILIIWLGFILSNPKSEYNLPVDFPKGAVLPKGLSNVEYEYNGNTWTMISLEKGTVKEVLSRIKNQLIKRNVQLQHYISMPHGEQCLFIKGQYSYTLEVLKTDDKDKVKVKFAISNK